jgi:hypothetical protein
MILYSYAAIRYHIGKEMGVDYFFFVFNKAIAWTSATYLGLSLLKLKAHFPTKKTLGISSFILGLFHISMTFVLVYLGFFPKYYDAQAISNEGFLILISGGLTFLIMVFPLLASTFPTNYPNSWLKLGKFALLINIFHPVIIGIKNWWIPGNWPLFLPPITLLTIVIYGVLLFIYWKQKKGVTTTPSS